MTVYGPLRGDMPWNPLSDFSTFPIAKLKKNAILVVREIIVQAKGVCLFQSQRRLELV